MSAELPIVTQIHQAKLTESHSVWSEIVTIPESLVIYRKRFLEKSILLCLYKDFKNKSTSQNDIEKRNLAVQKSISLASHFLKYYKNILIGQRKPILNRFEEEIISIYLNCIALSLIQIKTETGIKNDLSKIPLNANIKFGYILNGKKYDMQKQNKELVLNEERCTKLSSFPVYTFEKNQKLVYLQDMVNATMFYYFQHSD